MNQDSIKLLKECNAGCKSATNSMEQVNDFLEEGELKKIIKTYNQKHIDLGEECHKKLNEEKEEEKDPNPVSKMFAWMGTEMKMMINDDEKKIAELMVEGCNMGIKSLSQYLNQYSDAEQNIKDIARKLIQIEFDFMKDLLQYL